MALAGRLEINRPIVLFDEPTTALDHQNANAFLELLGQLLGRASVVFVSHRLPEILRTCSRVVVLKDGLKVGERLASETGEGELHQLMVGRQRTSNYYRQHDQRDVSLGRGPAASWRSAVSGTRRFAASRRAPGEILGVAGTDGSGKRELGEAIAGFGQSPQARSAWRASHCARRSRSGGAGVAYIPPDRLASGLIPGPRWRPTSSWPRWDRFAHRSASGGGPPRAAVTEVTNDLGIVCGRIDAEVSTLSGGNQQKVLLAKWLIRRPQVVVLDNPTQGVDTGARKAFTGSSGTSRAKAPPSS